MIRVMSRCPAVWMIAAAVLGQCDTRVRLAEA